MMSLGIQLEDIHFEQDNAPVYKAYSVMDWFWRKFIKVEEHHPYSPDLNPIEHAWDPLKKQSYLQYRRIRDTP